MQTISAPREAILRPLRWDSDHFGFPVARLDGAALNDIELRKGLEFARRRKVKLAYWDAEPGRVVPQPILDEFGGLLVDRKATFRSNLRPVDLDSQAPLCCQIREHPRSRPSPEVIRLAVAAGVCSRFRLDPRIPKDLFERLYENWIIRSTHGELADVVLIAERETSVGDPVGLITISVKGDHGSIGLFAVLESARGQGIGTTLLRAAHRFMTGHGAQKVTVVTQLANRAACRLYERRGYERAKLSDTYHFWP